MTSFLRSKYTIRKIITCKSNLRYSCTIKNGCIKSYIVSKYRWWRHQLWEFCIDFEHERSFKKENGFFILCGLRMIFIIRRLLAILARKVYFKQMSRQNFHLYSANFALSLLYLMCYPHHRCHLNCWHIIFVFTTITHWHKSLHGKPCALQTVTCFAFSFLHPHKISDTRFFIRIHFIRRMSMEMAKKLRIS